MSVIEWLLEPQQARLAQEINAMALQYRDQSFFVIISLGGAGIVTESKYATEEIQYLSKHATSNFYQVVIVESNRWANECLPYVTNEKSGRQIQRKWQQAAESALIVRRWWLAKKLRRTISLPTTKKQTAVAADS